MTADVKRKATLSHHAACVRTENMFGRRWGRGFDFGRRAAGRETSCGEYAGVYTGCVMNSWCQVLPWG